MFIDFVISSLGWLVIIVSQEGGAIARPVGVCHSDGHQRCADTSDVFGEALSGRIAGGDLPG